MESKKAKTIFHVGIRREDKSKWERRVSVTPAIVKEIQEKFSDIKFVVQPSKIRIFTDRQYEIAGADVCEDLSKCGTIFCVKEVPTEKMLKDKTYIYFAHVIKAQEANMPALDALLENHIRFIDYEKIMDKNGKRLVAFGIFAGIAGTIDLLSFVGKFLLTKGYSTPFLNICIGFYSQFLLINSNDLFLYEREYGNAISPDDWLNN